MQDLYPSRQAPAAEMLPRQDPVVHREWSKDAPISAQQAVAFDRDGYIVLEDIFSPKQVSFLQRPAGEL
ncbi:MAG TPA: ectoine hydroxylase, partial [Sphingopyxis sp.]|nr:ectoine hydroxylase [Sphingopyxis sp.]